MDFKWKQKTTKQVIVPTNRWLNSLAGQSNDQVTLNILTGKLDSTRFTGRGITFLRYLTKLTFQMESASVEVHFNISRGITSGNQGTAFKREGWREHIVSFITKTEEVLRREGQVIGASNADRLNRENAKALYPSENKGSKEELPGL